MKKKALIHLVSYKSPIHFSTTRHRIQCYAYENVEEFTVFDKMPKIFLSKNKVKKKMKFLSKTGPSSFLLNLAIHLSLSNIRFLVLKRQFNN